ncbi:MAG: ribonuclease H family protein [Cyclobacteriaceae bacterium]|nr:ribonuclease H family protein [Cyclobacteriaceae bacterium]MCH8516398.1 ribonuclease H family protein [Cyclobacteriaceae bacterium]
MAKKKLKWYVVWKGVKTGVFDSWSECQAQIAGYTGAQYKSFESLSEAEKAYNKGASDYIGKGSVKSSTGKAKVSRNNIIWDSIAVDAAASSASKLMEYRGVFTKSKKEIFRSEAYYGGTNNIGEFLAIVHALALSKAKGYNGPIYTDSKTAMSWVKKKKANTKFDAQLADPAIKELIDRAEKWLSTNTFENHLLKWETESWGEIPADFGRK